LGGVRYFAERNQSGLEPANFAISAPLSAEEDFELGGEFLDVFVRSGEHAAGFLAGCMLIAGVWILYAAL
jgi:hypothetical protein